MTFSYSYQVGSVKLLGLARLLGIWRASVYKLVFRELLIFCALYAALSCVYRLALTTAAHRKIFEKIVVYSGTFESIIPLTFILGFYVTLVVQRWWSQYMHIPWPDRIMSYVAVLIPGKDESTVMLRRTVVRYLIQAEVLLLRTISSTVKKRFPTVESLVDQGLMTANEYKLYSDDKVPHISSKYWVPTQWCAMLFCKARREGKIKDFPLCVLLDELNKYKDSLGTLFSYDWISIPLVYTQVATLAVYVFYFNTIMSRQYINFASVREEFGPEISAKYSIDLYVPIDTLVQLFFYLGWLKVAEQMINPFGEDDDDFECNWIVDRNLKVGLYAVDQMLAEPPPLERDRWWDKQDPQMWYTEASEKFAMTDGWFGSTANLEVPPTPTSHIRLPEIPELGGGDPMLSESSNFASNRTLRGSGCNDPEATPKKQLRRLPPLSISIDKLDEVKTVFTKGSRRRRSRTTATDAIPDSHEPGSPDICRSMPDTHFRFANGLAGAADASTGTPNTRCSALAHMTSRASMQAAEEAAQVATSTCAAENKFRLSDQVPIASPRHEAEPATPQARDGASCSQNLGSGSCSAVVLANTGNDSVTNQTADVFIRARLIETDVAVAEETAEESASSSTSQRPYVCEWISGHKEEFVSDAVIKGTYSASACLLNNLNGGGGAGGDGCGSGDDGSGISGAARKSVGNLPAIVELQGEVEKLATAGSEEENDAAATADDDGNNVERRVIFNPEIEKLEYNASFPPDQLRPSNESVESDQLLDNDYLQQLDDEEEDNYRCSASTACSTRSA